MPFFFFLAESFFYCVAHVKWGVWELWKRYRLVLNFRNSMLEVASNRSTRQQNATPRIGHWGLRSYGLKIIEKNQTRYFNFFCLPNTTCKFVKVLLTHTPAKTDSFISEDYSSPNTQDQTRRIMLHYSKHILLIHSYLFLSMCLCQANYRIPV